MYIYMYIYIYIYTHTHTYQRIFSMNYTTIFHTLNYHFQYDKNHQLPLVNYYLTNLTYGFLNGSKRPMSSHLITRKHIFMSLIHGLRWHF
jgi:hypothetical protein